MKKLDMSMLKKAIEDILVRKPDLDEGKQPPKAEDPDDGTSKAPNPKADVSSDSPEQAVTDKAAWDSLSDSEQTYVAAFVETCKQAGVDPALFVAPELLKWAGWSRTPMQSAALQDEANMAWGNLGFFGRMGQRISNPVRAARAAKAWANAPQQAMQGRMLELGRQQVRPAPAAPQPPAIPAAPQPAPAAPQPAPAAPQPPAIPGAPAQPQPEPKMAAYVAAFVGTCKQAGLTDEQAQALLGVEK